MPEPKTETKTEAKNAQDSGGVQHVKEPYLSQIKVLHEKRENLLPTPPIGAAIQWFRLGEVGPGKAIAGVVTKHIAPGVVAVVTFPFRAQIQHFDNVLFCKHPQAQVKGDKNIQRNGTWDYVTKSPPSKSHYSLHETTIDEQLGRLESQMTFAVNEYLDRQRMLNETTTSMAN